MTCHQVALEAIWLYLRVNLVVFLRPTDELQFARLLYSKEAAQRWNITVSDWQRGEGNMWLETDDGQTGLE